MTDMPNYNEMSMQQLLAAFNEMAQNKRRSAFPNLNTGIQRCEQEWNRVHTQEEVTVPRARRQGWGLKVLGENPHKPGTDAYDFYEAMKESPTIGDYVGRYESKGRKQAATIWLNNHKKAGRVEVSNG